MGVMGGRFVAVVAVALAFAGCGGGGGAGGPQAVPFTIAGSSPGDGEIDANTDAAIFVSFSRPANAATLTTGAVRLRTLDGLVVDGTVSATGVSPAVVTFTPRVPLTENVAYRVIVAGSIESAEGIPLGADRHICFITTSPLPRVRSDQVVDLGDRLQVARFHARWQRLAGGRVLIAGGFTSPTAATDTLEIYEPATGTFRLLAGRLSSPRGEHAIATLLDGHILVSGGAAFPGGPPLATTDLFDPASEAVVPGPPMREARRWHACSAFETGSDAMVSGGFGASGDPLDTIEVRRGGAFVAFASRLPEPTAQHVQILFDLDQVYFSSGNFLARGAFLDGAGMVGQTEGDIRFRPAVAQVGSDRHIIVGGDTRSATTVTFTGRTSVLATDVTFERRGAHSLTLRGSGARRFLVAGGFNIATQGIPALATMEVMDYLPVGAFGAPDMTFYRVDTVKLPVPFAGHVGFNDVDGSTVLAGGVGDGAGPHSRRVVRILPEESPPAVACGG